MELAYESLGVLHRDAVETAMLLDERTAVDADDLSMVFVATDKNGIGRSEGRNILFHRISDSVGYAGCTEAAAVHGHQFGAFGADLECNDMVT